VPGAKHAVHRASKALGALLQFIVCGVHAAETQAIYASPFIMVFAFVAITLISDPNYTEWRHKAM
jgi:hypothetical protein